MMPGRLARTGVLMLSGLALATLMAAEPAIAQQKKQDIKTKQSACVAKARAENPNDGKARQQAYERCMGR